MTEFAKMKFIQDLHKIPLNIKNMSFQKNLYAAAGFRFQIRKFNTLSSVILEFEISITFYLTFFASISIQHCSSYVESFVRNI